MASSDHNKYKDIITKEESGDQAGSPLSSSDMVTASEMKGGEYMPLNVSEGPTDGSSRPALLNRKALLSFMVVTVVVVAIISLTVIFVVFSDSKKSSKNSKQRRDEVHFQFDNMFDGMFHANIPDDKWISDNSILVEDDGRIIRHNYATHKTTELFSKAKLESLGIFSNVSMDFALSPDGSWMLFAYDKLQKYRYSTVAKYFAVKVKSTEKVDISTSEGSSSLIRYISWGTQTNSLVFVSDNDIYWIKSIDDPNSKAVRVTSTGKEKIFNGIPDWVYEEEILSERPAVIISPDEQHLCYATFNDTEVPLYDISLYGQPSAAYTRIQDIAYPKPGFPNPKVSIYVYDVNTKKAIEIKPPADISRSDFYFTNLVWASSKNVSVTWMNRAQNVSAVMLCSAEDGACMQNYIMEVPDGWVNQDYPDPMFSADGSFYVQVLPKYEGENGEFLHIALVPSTENANDDVKFFTGGEWEVKRIVSFDKENDIIYYESSEVSPTQLHLYSVDLNGTKACVTCEMNETKEGRCRYYFSRFSKKNSWFILTCKGPSPPITWLRSTRNDTVVVIEPNKGLRETVKATTMPTYEYFTVKTTDGAYDLHMRELRPPDFDKNKKYAVLFNVYGGPGSQVVLETFQADYHTYLTSNYDIIVCEVDGRGTASRGRRFERAVYNQLGEYEGNDTIAAARFMQSKRYVDPDRIAIWGWSYGGFLSSFILSTQEERVFRSAVAVAPVTDWRYYDSIYTERYMGQPSERDNNIGYEHSSVLKYAANIPDNSFLLIHGTGDDNVHFQNTAQLIRKLTETGVKFELQIYTDRHHSLEGPGIHRHLYHLMTDFHKDKLSL